MVAFRNNQWKGMLFLTLAIILSGCHSIRPMAVADGGYLDRLPKSPKSILLVMDDNYRNYVSTDRGNDSADPQTYYVGEALVPLTETFLKRAYAQVETRAGMPSDIESQKGKFIIYPKVKSFANQLEIMGCKQTIDVALAADIFDANRNPVGQSFGEGSATANLGAAAMFLGSTKKSGQTVSWALQDALTQLVSETVKKTR